MPCGFWTSFERDRPARPVTGRPSRDRGRNKAQRKARRKARR